MTDQQGLQQPTTGQADWDQSLNGNFTIAERGYHVKAVAGIAVDTGDVLWINSGGFAFRYHPSSLTTRPHVFAYKAVASGEEDFFLAKGAVRSLSVFSSMVPGQPAYVSTDTPGVVVNSDGANRVVGFGIAEDGLFFNPSGALRFVELFDAPNTAYNVNTGKVVAVNTTGTGLYFQTPGGGGGGTGSGTLYGRQPFADVSAWTQINTGSMVFATIADSALLLAVTSTDTTERLMQLVVAPTSRDQGIFGCAIQPLARLANFNHYGISLRNSNNGRSVVLGVTQLAATAHGLLEFNRWTSNSQFLGQVSSRQIAGVNTDLYLRFIWTNTTIAGELSVFKANTSAFWHRVWTEVISTHIASIDQVGVHLHSTSNGSAQFVMGIFHDHFATTSVG